MEFQSLPEEVLESIINISGLLTCRLVSRQWNRISTALCRRRFVHLNSDWLQDPSCSTVLSVFTNVRNLPWSSIVIEEWDCMVSAFCDDNARTFMDLYGSQLLQATFKGIYFYRLLSRIPNIPNVLRLCISKPVEDYEVVCPAFPGILGNLKCLEIVQEEGKQFSLSMLQFLISCTSRKLQQLVLKNLFIDADFIERFTALLAQIPYISISINYQHASELPLTSILSKIQAQSSAEGRALLEKLGTLEGISQLSSSDIAFEFRNFSKQPDSPSGHSNPILRFSAEVKILKLKFRCSSTSNESNDFVLPLISDMFPFLEGVVMSSSQNN